MTTRYHAYLLLLAFGCAGGAQAAESGDFHAIDLREALTPAGLADQLESKRVVFVGETHNRYGDHLNQLKIIEEVYSRDPSIAIGVEYLQRRFQSRVDDYIEGRSTEQDFLRATQYYSGWGYDYRLYAPIFRYAREHHIPVRALNVPPSLPSAVAKVGVEGLSAEQRAELPKDMQPAGEAYEARLREVFGQHGAGQRGEFERFVQAQLVWDEGMAESAAEYLEANPDRRMVILTGSGHLAFGYGIPERLQRRMGASYGIVLNDNRELEPRMADYVLIGDEQSLPPAGVLGIRMEDKDGRCRVVSFAPGSAAQKSGIEADDVLVEIDGEAVTSVADVRAALWDKKPGQRVTVGVHRRHRRKTQDLSFDVTLAGPHGLTAHP